MRLGEAESNAAQAGVTHTLRAFLFGEPARVQCRIDQWSIELPLVDVERADGDRPGRHAFDELSIDVILLVFGGHVRRAADQHELGSV